MNPTRVLPVFLSTISHLPSLLQSVSPTSSLTTSPSGAPTTTPAKNCLSHVKSPSVSPSAELYPGTSSSSDIEDPREPTID
eukprot:scaffold3284_cov67-Cyclotella_meneghiniana.AAC.6